MFLALLKILTVSLLTMNVAYSASEPLAGSVKIALSPEASLGREIFNDESLSASGRMSCATCHDAAYAFARRPGQGPVAVGGANLDIAGFRKVPSLRYLARTPAFFFDRKNGKVTPTGGLARDGRANTLAEQARLPLLSPQEMANASAQDVAEKLSRASYAMHFRSVFGENIFAEPRMAFQKALRALQQFQLEDTAQFAPFSSKYDYFLAGKTQLSLQEQRGLALFEDPQKGNCAACHPSARGEDGQPPLFTDFTYDNIGVPRNAAIPANQNERYFDLGLCGPFRKDLSRHTELCGAFKVPTLRNVAVFS
jgi:cytochrome c peroxidase